MARASALIVVLSAATLTIYAQTPSRDAPPPSQQTAATATIRGRVMIAGTDVPVRKARVTLATDTGASAEPIYADNDGRFEFLGVKPGRYIVAAWKSGYVETKFGARDRARQAKGLPVQLRADRSRPRAAAGYVPREDQ